LTSLAGSQVAGSDVNIKKDMIITIDGPSGAGKSTIAKMLAGEAGFTYIDSGAIYRGIAYAYRNRENNETIGELLPLISLTFEFGENTRVLLGELDISDGIRLPEISLLASSLSQDRSVRDYANAIQRRLGGRGRVVLEGRDTGSVVFPDADIKFYLDAGADERAGRRHLELSAKGSREAMKTVKEEMEKRDKNDSERAIAPLVIPDGAIYVDTTGIGPEEVLKTIMGHIEKRNAGK